MKPTPPPGRRVRKRSAARTIGLALAWLLGIPFALIATLYVALLIHPIPLPFLGTQLRNIVMSSMPEGNEIELGEMALALEGYAWPVIQFSPVVFRDTVTGARVEMDALEVGFSPVRALIGQPGATVTMVGPHIQINQDLFGPRLANLEVVPDPEGGTATVRVMEGTQAFPDAGFSSDGIQVRGEVTELTRVRSDNDWIVMNLEAAQASIASVIEQADMGRFSRLIIRDATVDMNDAIYATLRTFRNIALDIAPSPDGRSVEGNFSADFGGTIMQGIFERVRDGDEARLKISLNNFDLSSFAPVINESGGIAGPVAVSLDVGFDSTSGKILDGSFRFDMTGTDLRVDTQEFPIASNIIEVDWAPQTGTFTMAESAMNVGGATLRLNGVFVLGYDELYGPIAAMSLAGREITVPNAAGVPSTIFDNVSFQGWSAPLYGATGIDQAILARDDGARLEARGRIDMVRRGMGLDITVAGAGFTADDIKSLWPAMGPPEAREWFVKNVVGGRIDSANMKLSFPVGTLALDGDLSAMPQNGVSMEVVASGVRVNALEGAPPIEIQGKTRLQVHDSEVTLAADGGVIQTKNGNISVANAALVMTSETPEESIVEVSGDLSGGIPAIAAIAEQFQPEGADAGDTPLPVDLDTLTGNISVRLVATTTLDRQGATKAQDFSVTGNVQDLGTSEPVTGEHRLTGGQFAFMATQAGFQVSGSANLGGVTANVAAEGDLTTGAMPPPMTIAASARLEDLAKLGFDTGDIGRGPISVSARPQANGAIDVEVDLKDATLAIADLGIRKPAGRAGAVKATIRQQGDATDITNLDLAFGTVKVRGSLQVDAKKGLQAAEFSNFALSEGDAAQLSMTPIQDGYAVRIRGDQLDLKPVLTRAFDLNQGSGGVQATSFTQTLALDVELKRALGMFKTNAFNLNLNMALRGTDIRNVSMQGQIGTQGQVSIATNPSDAGRTMTVVFNDLGSILRFLGTYPQMQGGEGSFVLAMNPATKVDNGTINLKNFVIVDERNLAALVEGHPDTRRALRSGNSMVFDSAKADFVRRTDRIQIVEAVVAGDTVGGSGEGFIYTDRKQYDLVGTFVPMFGINNAFGRLFGGGNNGMWGITFAVSGPLDKPDFKVNPLSLLAPGAFRSLFEFRTREQPRAQ